MLEKYSRESLKDFLRSQGLSCGEVSGLFLEVIKKRPDEGTSLVVQWLKLSDPKAGGADLIPGQGTR